MKFKRVIFERRIVMPSGISFDEVVTEGSPEYEGAGQQQVDQVLEDRRGLTVVRGGEAVLVPWHNVAQANGKTEDLSTRQPSPGAGGGAGGGFDIEKNRLVDRPVPIVDPPVIPPPLDGRHRARHGAARGGRPSR